MMKTFAQIGTEIGELVERKNAAYGSSFAKAGEFLALLYPNGLQPAQYGDALLLVRIFDKQMRLATDGEAFGESPYADIAGYGVLGAHWHQQQKEERAAWPGNAKGPDATDSSKGQPASVAPSTSERITTSARGTTAPEPSPQPDGCCDPFPAATAPSATGAASPSGDGRLGLDDDDLLVLRYIADAYPARRSHTEIFMEFPAVRMLHWHMEKLRVEGLIEAHYDGELAGSFVVTAKGIDLLAGRTAPPKCFFCLGPVDPNDYWQMTGAPFRYFCSQAHGRAWRNSVGSPDEWVCIYCGDRLGGLLSAVVNIGAVPDKLLHFCGMNHAHVYLEGLKQ